jgi:protein-S-isoprenylcysteine O-methyltransferase Ste14
MEYLLLALLWTGWCILHSLLISARVIRFLEMRLGDRYRFTRILFNIFALLSLIPVVAYGHTLSGDHFIRWDGIWRLVQIPMLVFSLWLFAAGAREYDLQQLLGIRQIVEHESAKGLSPSGDIETSGILGRMRHPWYSGAILILWSRDIDAAALVTNLVLTAYLIAGTHLEERKLISEFGEEYVRYQRKVPMLIPRLSSRKGPERGESR